MGTHWGQSCEEGSRSARLSNSSYIHIYIHCDTTLYCPRTFRRQGQFIANLYIYIYIYIICKFSYIPLCEFPVSVPLINRLKMRSVLRNPWCNSNSFPCKTHKLEGCKCTDMIIHSYSDPASDTNSALPLGRAV